MSTSMAAMAVMAAMTVARSKFMDVARSMVLIRALAVSISSEY